MSAAWILLTLALSLHVAGSTQIRRRYYLDDVVGGNPTQQKHSSNKDFRDNNLYSLHLANVVGNSYHPLKSNVAGKPYLYYEPSLNIKAIHQARRFLFTPTVSSFPYGDPGHQGGAMWSMFGPSSQGGDISDPMHQGGAQFGSTQAPISTVSHPSTAIVSETTTATKATTTPAPTSTTVDSCAVAKNLCHTSCPTGYLVDPDDCTFCVCKKDALSG